MDYPYTVSLMDDRVHSSQVEDAMRGIVDVINKRARSPGTPSTIDDEHSDIKYVFVPAPTLSIHQLLLHFTFSFSYDLLMIPWY